MNLFNCIPITYKQMCFKMLVRCAYKLKIFTRLASLGLLSFLRRAIPVTRFPPSGLRACSINVSLRQQHYVTIMDKLKSRSSAKLYTTFNNYIYLEKCYVIRVIYLKPRSENTIFVGRTTTQLRYDIDF